VLKVDSAGVAKPKRVREEYSLKMASTISMLVCPAEVIR